MKPPKTICLLLLITLAASDLVRAEDGIVVTRNRADEPLAKTFSAQKSIVFIERSVQGPYTRETQDVVIED